MTSSLISGHPGGAVRALPGDVRGRPLRREPGGGDRDPAVELRGLLGHAGASLVSGVDSERPGFHGVSVNIVASRIKHARHMSKTGKTCQKQVKACKNLGETSDS